MAIIISTDWANFVKCCSNVQRIWLDECVPRLFPTYFASFLLGQLVYCSKGVCPNQNQAPLSQVYIKMCMMIGHMTRTTKVCDTHVLDL